MGLFHFGITSLIMVMLFFCVLQLQKTNRHAGIHQPSLRSVRRCLMVMVGLLCVMLLSSVGRIWQAYPDWEAMTAPLIDTVMLLFPSYFVRLLLRAYRIKKATVAEFSAAPRLARPCLPHG